MNRRHTLRAAWQFRTVYDHGDRVVGSLTVLFYHSTPSDQVKVGVVASKKVGNAVSRNRAKRLIREASRELIKRIDDKNIWLVVVARSTINGNSCQDVVADLERSLKTAGLI